MVLSIFALISLIPSILLPYRHFAKRDLLFYSMLTLALVVVLSLVLVRQSAGWKTDLSTALWLTIFTCLILHTIVAIISKDGWRLTPLLMPYLFIVGVLATILSDSTPDHYMINYAPTAWVNAHIFVSILTYGLITLSAISALAASIQARALKSKKRTSLSALLPSLTSSEKLVLRFLFSGELILTVGMITGMALLYLGEGKVIIFDHKTIFVLVVFLIIGCLLLVNHNTGARGKVFSHLVLLAYLFLTLGYPGVKVVTQFILV